MKNSEPENKILRAVGNTILYGAAVCTMFALIGSAFFWLFSIYFETKHNSESVSAIKEDLSYIRSDLSDLKNDVSVLKEDVAVLKEDVSVLKEDVEAIKGKLNLPEQPVSF